MDNQFATAILRVSIAALLAGVLGACATTQRTSSGMGTTDDAAASTPGPATTQTAASQPALKPVLSAEPSDANTDATSRGTGNTAITGTGLGSEGSDPDKKGLADQDAPAKSMDAAKPNQPAAETTADAAKQSSASVAAPAAASAKPTDTQAVFPADSNASKSDASNQYAKKPTERSVYFEFDKSTIKEQYEAVLKAQAAFLEAHKSFSAEVQGNCDERGSREYNLALGARRAEAVKQALVLLGVDGEKLKTVSFGSEKPVALGKNEDSYTQNRRVDIVD
ncbi:MAG: peptidoglycan-associated lipoprotein Pal [Betaproteobacteria bacterium]